MVAAFDHRHVFTDPAPDPAVSFAERQRLFSLPRSSWADYNEIADLGGHGGAWPRHKLGEIGARCRIADARKRSVSTPR